MVNETFDYVDYLSIKKQIDDASLNPKVWTALVDWIRSKSQNKKPLRVLEIGAGIGTMIERLLDDYLPASCTYIAVEPEEKFIAAARERIILWATFNNAEFKILEECRWQLIKGKSEIIIEWCCSDADSFPDNYRNSDIDLIISHAVVDLLPVPIILPKLLACLAAEGAFYFSLNYAGETKFSPQDRDDTQLMQAYNADMDKRFPNLEWTPSLTGKNLAKWIRGAGLSVRAEGNSDWKLDAREKLFIGNILDTIKKALSEKPAIDGWYSARSAQLENGDLKLEISNVDIFGVKNQD